MQHIASINGNALIQDGNLFYIIYDHMYDVSDLSWVKNPEEELALEAKIELLPNGQLKIHHLQELYQFNCCGDLLNVIKLIQLITKENVDLSNPTQFTVTGFTDEKYTVDEEKFRATFSFKYKGKELNGDGTFIKYWFFKGLEESATSVTDLMTLYVAIMKLTAKACHAANDDMFLQCDNWIIDRNNRKNGGYGYSLKQGVI